MEEDLMARQYTREFKLEALRLAKENGYVTGMARARPGPKCPLALEKGV